MSNPAFRHEHIVYYYCSHLFTVHIASQIQRYRVIIRRQIRIRVAKAISATDEPICRFRCRKTDKNTSRFTWNIEAEPFRTIQSHQGGNVETTQNYNAHQEKLAIQNHSEPFESPSNSRCPLRCRNQRIWTTGVCDCVWLSMPQRSNVTSSGSSLRVFSLRFPCVGCQVPLADLGSSSTESIAAL